MTNSIEAFKAAKETLRNAKEEAKKHMKEAIIGLLQPIFAEFKELQAIRWGQGTPSFNDGDPCVFGVHGLDAKLHPTIGTDVERVEDDDDEEGDWEDVSSYGQPEGDVMHKLEDFYGEISECQEILQATFGDGARITIDRDLNVEVEDDWYPY